MKKIANSALDLVGNTPMVELSRLGREAGAVARVVAKVELFNPAGSVKDRIALAMVEEAKPAVQSVPEPRSSSPRAAIRVSDWRSSAH